MPENPEYLALSAQIYAEIKKWDKARELFDRGFILFEKNELHLAKSALSESLDLYGCEKTRGLLGQVYERELNEVKAEVAYKLAKENYEKKDYYMAEKDIGRCLLLSNNQMYQDVKNEIIQAIFSEEKKRMCEYLSRKEYGMALLLCENIGRYDLGKDFVAKQRTEIENQSKAKRKQRVLIYTFLILLSIALLTLWFVFKK